MAFFCKEMLQRPWLHQQSISQHIWGCIIAKTPQETIIPCCEETTRALQSLFYLCSMFRISHFPVLPFRGRAVKKQWGKKPVLSLLWSAELQSSIYMCKRGARGPNTVFFKYFIKFMWSREHWFLSLQQLSIGVLSTQRSSLGLVQIMVSCNFLGFSFPALSLENQIKPRFV